GSRIDVHLGDDEPRDADQFGLRDVDTRFVGYLNAHSTHSPHHHRRPREPAARRDARFIVRSGSSDFAYASTISETSRWRTTSTLVSSATWMSSTLSRISIAERRPDLAPPGRSTCVMSPVTTIFDPKPKRVRNIFICSAVVFCASSRTMNAELRLRPRMYASGATSITPADISLVISSGSIMSYSASYNGRRYGSIFSLSVPGKKPRRSPASTAGRVKMMRLTCLVCRALTALAIARYVLPVPAGPTPKTMVLASMAST